MQPRAAVAQTGSIDPTGGREEGEVSPEPPTVSIKGKEKADTTPAEVENWVKKTSKGGNMSLMTVQKRYVDSLWLILRFGNGAD